MASFNQTTAVALQRRLYPDGLNVRLFKNNPAFAMAKKWTGFNAEGKFQVINHAPGGGASATFASAQTNASAGKYIKPFITHAFEYATAEIDGITLQITKDPANIGNAFKVAMDHALNNLRRSVGLAMYGTGRGDRGVVGSVAGNVITLKNKNEARNFSIDMVLQVMNDATSALRSGTMKVTVVDFDNNKITVDTIVAGTDADDVLVRDGDFNNLIKGPLGGWVPIVAPVASESFFTIDRSVHPTMLAGQRYAPSAGEIREILIDGAARVEDLGVGTPDVGYLNPLDFATLAKEAESTRFVDVKTTSAKVSFKGISLLTGSGEVELVADPNCPRKQAWIGERGTLEIWSAGEFPRVLDFDGLRMSRKASSDSYETRLGGYLQGVNTNPAAWVAVTLP